MSENYLPSTLLLIIGILCLVKFVWCLAQPSSVKRVAEWWSEQIPKFRIIIAGVCFALTIFLLLVVLRDQGLVNWLLVLLGILFAWMGSMYLNLEKFGKLMNTLIINRTPSALRVISVLGAALSALLIYAAL